MQKIRLTQGKVALVDSEDYEELSKHKWYAHKEHNIWYARRRIGAKTIRMHREILRAERGDIVDHINRDGLDNRRDNLRIVSHRENVLNSRMPRRRGKTSRYRGVRLHSSGLWQARITDEHGQQKLLGYFQEEEDAARAYDKAAQTVHGKFAQLNKI